MSEPSMMQTRRGAVLSLGAVVLAAPVVATCARPLAVLDPLPSWNDGPAKRALLDFVDAVTVGAATVPPAQRIAVFDNDGTLWAEQPIYIEVQFMLDRARQMLRDNPSLGANGAFRSLTSARSAADLSQADMITLMGATHTGEDPDAFQQRVRVWLRDARHPRFDLPYTQCIYQPMLEVLALLRARAFKTFIVSGGGVDFMRTFAASTYGVPPEQVIGSSGQYEYEVRNRVGQVIKTAQLGSVDDGAGKPQNIALHIGQRPLAAFGNSDGDREMLEYATTGPGRRFGLLVHHDDAHREYAYDRGSPVGALSAALDEAEQRGWTVVSMRNDWRTIFPAPERANNA